MRTWLVRDEMAHLTEISLDDVAAHLGSSNGSGPQGPAGPPGPAGNDGATGAQGPAGAVGAQGPAGNAGTQGQAGATGSTGAQGPAGDTGATGQTGPQGNTGMTGNPGIQGPPGADGAQGPPGTYTPVHATLANGTTALAFGTPRDSVKVTPTATATLTTTVPPAGRRCAVIVLTSGTTSFVLTFGSGFKPVGTLATGTTTNRVFVVNFISDGNALYEAGRTAAMAA